jgi:hypothetical protein
MLSMQAAPSDRFVSRVHSMSGIRRWTRRLLPWLPSGPSVLSALYFLFFFSLDRKVAGVIAVVSCDVPCP